MAVVKFISKNREEYEITMNERDDFLSTLDNFFKKHKLSLANMKMVTVFCENKESMSYRIINSLIEAIKIKISNI